MAQYDGVVSIVTKITTKDAEESLSSLEYQIKKSAKEIDSLRSKMDALKDQKIPTEEYKELQDELSKAEKPLSSLIALQEEWNQLGLTSGSAWDELSEKIATASGNVDAIKEKIQALIDAGKDFTLGKDTAEYASYARQIQYEEKAIVAAGEHYKELLKLRPEMQAKIEAEAAEEKRLTQIRENAVVNNQHIVDVLERRKQLAQEIATMEKAGIGLGYQQYDSAKQELASLDQEIKEYSSSTEEMQSSYIRLGDSVKIAFSIIGKGLIDIPIAVVKNGASGLLSIFSRIGNVVKNTVSGAFKRLGSVAKSVFAKITQHVNKFSGVLSNFAGRVKNLVVSFLSFNRIRKIFSSTTSAIKEGFSNLYEENARFKSSIDNLKAGILTLKNALATAFTPIVEVAIPYIQRLVEWLSKAADSVGQLMAAITGRKTYTKAIKQTTAALKEETKASNKQISSLDKLNNLTTSQSGDTTDAGAGDMFEEVPISDKWKDIAQWLKDMWENSDFYELGKLLGEKLKNTLDSIPWDIIKNTAQKIGKSLASFINGFIEVDGLGYSIGKTLVEAINTGFEFLNAFVHELHWESVGKFIADTINGFFQNIDWPLIYDTLVTAAAGLGNAINSFVEVLDWETIANAVSNFFNTLIDTIYTFITTTDWIALAKNLGNTISDAFTGIDWIKAGQTVGEAFKAFFNFIATTIENIDWWAVGESVRDFLIGIDWNSVADAFFETIGAIWGAFGAFLGGLIVEGIDNAKQYFQGKIEEAGGDIVGGILLGIRDGLANIAEWLLKHLYEPFMEGFCKAFGIHSPSTVMAEMGGFIVSGLLNGLKEKWNDIVEWITSKIQWLTSKIQSMTSIMGKAKSALSGGFGSALGNAFKNYSIDSGIQVPVSPVYAALSNVEIPAYATGQVIPRTMKQHLAILGDNTRETEIVSPLSTMKQALAEALAETGFGGGGDINLNLTVECEGYQLLQVMQKLDREYFKQTGRHAFA